MKALIISLAAFAGMCASAAAAPPGGAAPADDFVVLAGNTSSNSSSNTSSNQSNGRSSIVHTHRWSIDSGDGRRRRVIGGTTRIERYRPEVRHRAWRRGRDDD